MTDTEFTKPALLNGWRIAGWGAALALLALPAIAMRFTGEVQWTGTDFLFAAILIAALGTATEFAVRTGKSGMHRAALITAAIAAFLTVWINAAVGIIGDGPINLAFFVMVLVVLAAGFLTRFRAKAMVRIMAIMVAGQIAVGFVAEFTLQPDWGPVLFMTMVWLFPTMLFFKAAAD